MNEFLLVTIGLVVFILMMCKCTEVACMKTGPIDIVDVDHSIDPFADFSDLPFDDSHLHMGPYGYLKGPVVHRLNARHRPLP